MLFRIRSVPGEMVYRRFWVRSSCQPARESLKRIVRPMKVRASAATAPQPSVERLVMVLSLVRLAQVEGDRGGEEEKADQHREIKEVARLDDSLGDRLEMGEEGERGDRADERLRRPALERIHHHRIAGEQEREAAGDAENEGHDLVARQRRHAGADREEAAG